MIENKRQYGLIFFVLVPALTAKALFEGNLLEIAIPFAAVAVHHLLSFHPNKRKKNTQSLLMLYCISLGHVFISTGDSQAFGVIVAIMGTVSILGKILFDLISDEKRNNFLLSCRIGGNGLMFLVFPMTWESQNWFILGQRFQMEPSVVSKILMMAVVCAVINTALLVILPSKIQTRMIS